MLKRYRADLGVLALVVAGFALNIYAPLWFTPPLFEYTVWLYLLLFFAWVPAYILLLRRQRRPSLMALTILVGSILLACTCMTVRPRSAFTVTFFDSVECEQQNSPHAGRVRYACTRVSFEGAENNITLLFESLPGLPVMWWVAGDY